MLWMSTIQAVAAVLRADCELVHFHDSELIPAGLFLRVCGRKVIYDVHENLPAAILSKPYLRSATFRRALSKAINAIEKLAARGFDGLVAARPDIAETFRHGNICTLRNFPKLADLDKKGTAVTVQKARPSVIYVGGMSRIRGTKELIDAFQYLDGAELWLLGPFTDGEAFFEECQRSAGWARTKYFGKVQPYEIFGYMEQADIGIVTFWPEPNHLTTLATKPFEYMAKGLPIIMSDFPYWRDFFGDCGVYVDPKAPAEIAAAVESLLASPERRAQMGARNRRIIEAEYNWEMEEKKLLSLYDGLLRDLG